MSDALYFFWLGKLAHSAVGGVGFGAGGFCILTAIYIFILIRCAYRLRHWRRPGTSHLLRSNWISYRGVVHTRLDLIRFIHIDVQADFVAYFYFTHLLNPSSFTRHRMIHDHECACSAGNKRPASRPLLLPLDGLSPGIAL